MIGQGMTFGLVGFHTALYISRGLKCDRKSLDCVALMEIMLYVMLVLRGICVFNQRWLHLTDKNNSLILGSVFLVVCSYHDEVECASSE